MLRKVLLAVLLWLAVGAALTVAGSWSIAAWMPLRPNSNRFLLDVSRYNAQDGLGISVHQDPGWTRRTWLRMISVATIFPMYSGNDRSPYEVIGPDPVSWPAWGRLETARDNRSAQLVEGCEHATGWPFPALWYEFHTSRSKSPATPPVFSIRGGVSLSAILSPQTFQRVHALPWRPIWPGLLINSTLYGLFARAIYFGSSRLRRSLRLRRNHCPHCNYELSASPTSCPECGWNRLQC